MANLSIDNPSVTIALGLPWKQRLIAVCEAVDLSAAQLLRRAIAREENKAKNPGK